jgi:hypothetical protein
MTPRGSPPHGYCPEVQRPEQPFLGEALMAVPLRIENRLAAFYNWVDAAVFCSHFFIESSAR